MGFPVVLCVCLWVSGRGALQDVVKGPIGLLGLGRHRVWPHTFHQNLLVEHLVGREVGEATATRGRNLQSEGCLLWRGPQVLDLVLQDLIL